MVSPSIDTRCTISASCLRNRSMPTTLVSVMGKPYRIARDLTSELVRTVAFSGRGVHVRTLGQVGGPLNGPSAAPPDPNVRVKSPRVFDLVFFTFAQVVGCFWCAEYHVV